VQKGELVQISPVHNTQKATKYSCFVDNLSTKRDVGDGFEPFVDETCSLWTTCGLCKNVESGVGGKMRRFSYSLVPSA
jgi:hypothetical protein